MRSMALLGGRQAVRPLIRLLYVAIGAGVVLILSKQGIHVPESNGLLRRLAREIGVVIARRRVHRGAALRGMRDDV